MTATWSFAPSRSCGGSGCASSGQPATGGRPPVADPADDLDLDLTGELSDGAIEALVALLIASQAAAASEEAA